jgi:hypothetical protein
MSGNQNRRLESGRAGCRLGRAVALAVAAYCLGMGIVTFTPARPAMASMIAFPRNENCLERAGGILGAMYSTGSLTSELNGPSPTRNPMFCNGPKFSLSMRGPAAKNGSPGFCTTTFRPARTSMDSLAFGVSSINTRSDVLPIAVAISAANSRLLRRSHWRPSQTETNDASEIETKQLELPF